MEHGLPQRGIDEALSTLDSPEREIKYSFNNERAAEALRYIRGICRPDPAFASGFINSIYYDSPRLRHLGEKANSDYLKTKFRVRWYEDLNDGGRLPNTYFVEIKSRTGGLRSKRRISVHGPERHVAGLQLEHPRLREVFKTVRHHGILLHDQLAPILMIRYKRYRFVDPSSGARISLDCDIAVPKFSRRVLPRGRKVTLRSAVVEIKGRLTELPPRLCWLTHMGLRKASFSKYLVCVEKCAGFEVGM